MEDVDLEDVHHEVEVGVGPLENLRERPFEGVLDGSSVLWLQLLLPGEGFILFYSVT